MILISKANGADATNTHAVLTNTGRLIPMFAKTYSISSRSRTQSEPLTADLNYRTNLVTAPAYRHFLNTHATAQTLLYGPQEGEIIAVVPSPFAGDTRVMAFVANLPGQPAWTDYIPLKDTPEYNSGDCPDCGGHFPESRMCPECGYCLGCCDCVTEHADDLLDVPDYEPPRFLWMGRLFPELAD